MAKLLEWDPRKLSVNDAGMDKEHEEMVSRINRLYDLYAAKASAAELTRTMDDLYGAAAVHFAAEECRMEKLSFPETATHKIIHRDMLGRLDRFRRDVASGMPLSADFFALLRTFLTDHIMGADLSFARFQTAKISHVQRGDQSPILRPA